MPKENQDQPRILDPAKLSFGNLRENETFSDAGKLGELVSSRPTLQECPQDALETQRKRSQKEYWIGREEKGKGRAEGQRGGGNAVGSKVTAVCAGDRGTRGS